MVNRVSNEDAERGYVVDGLLTFWIDEMACDDEVSESTCVIICLSFA